MTVSALDIGGRAPHLRGRAPKAVQVEFVRELEEGDIALLASERGVQKPALLQNGLRERHHQLARMLARGSKPSDAAAVTGYSISRISILQADPTFQELMAHYREVKDAAFADFQERAAAVALDGLNIIADRMEDAPDEISTSMALEIVKQLADRTGHSPVSKAVNVNVNADLNDRLARARARVQQAYAEQDALPATGT